MSTVLVVIGVLGVVASIVALTIHVITNKSLKVWSMFLGASTAVLLFALLT